LTANKQSKTVVKVEVGVISKHHTQGAEAMQTNRKLTKSSININSKDTLQKEESKGKQSGSWLIQ
jgi:hypothetical protein